MDLFARSRKGIFILAAIFCALVGIFAAIASVIAIPAFKRYTSFPFLAISGTTFFLLGVALIFLTLKQKVGGMLKKFLILTGASSAGFFVSVLLHNAIYGLFIHWFGADFWDRIGVKDEPFFFIMATLVCPIGFLVGAVGSAALFIKKRKRG
jgi:hypothetical protein